MVTTTLVDLYQGKKLVLNVFKVPVDSAFSNSLPCRQLATVEALGCLHDLRGYGNMDTGRLRTRDYA